MPFDADAGVRSFLARTITVCASSLVLATPAAAQCGDGSPPPCRATAAARPVPIDPNRVAVIPFRVTTADSLLGEGFAELLAPEFTGEGGPRSIDMSSTLAAWRRAGGGLRTPLSQDAALQLSRQLGAGVLCQGSIVGVGGRLTINATLLDASTGRTIGNPARATGLLDSMEVLLGRVATGLLGAGARPGTAEAGRLTSSPAALRAYLEGLALRRRGNRVAAAEKFEASFAADTTFAGAAFQRWLIAALLAGSAEWQQRTIALRDRLSPSDRLVVDGSITRVPRSRAQTHADKKRAALQVESPEAWYLYGDHVYHSGLPDVGPDSVVPIAREAFERSMALDSSVIGVAHLATIAVRARDTSLMRRLVPFIDKMDGEDRWSLGWKIAAARGDAAQLARLRQMGPDASSGEFTAIGLYGELDTPAPIALIDEGFQQFRAVANQVERDRMAGFQWLIHRARGRPQSAERVASAFRPPHWRLNIAGSPWTAFTGDVSDDAAFLRDFGAAVPDSASEQRRQCVAARLAAQRGRADSLDLASRQRTGARCARILGLWQAFATQTLTDAQVAELDSIVSFTTFANFTGYEHRLLARIYEVRGDTVRALRAVRLYPRDFTGAWLAPTLREEGRYYLLARDTANAIRSYNHFLELRAEAEPPYVAERDSIKALVATLARRR